MSFIVPNPWRNEFQFFAQASDVVDAVTDLPNYSTGDLLLLVLPVGAIVRHNSGLADGTHRAVILRSGADFTAAGRTRVIELYYGSNGASFFWVQPE